MPRFAVPLLLLLAACAALPRDTDGTLERVAREGRFTVGIVADGGDGPGAEASDLVARVAAAAGARPVAVAGGAEPLLMRLREGGLDLVVGEFRADSPWAAEVAMLPPLARWEAPDGRHMIAAAARHGENRWIALLHRESRAVADRP